MSRLYAAWSRCFDDLGCAAPPPPRILDDLKARYSEPHRAYHTLQHLEECFGWFEKVRDLSLVPGELAFALFYHDAIYDTHASDNEWKSAQLAVDIFEAFVTVDTRAVAALILATTHHATVSGSQTSLLVDIDLSILGAEPARFDEYERQVRREYAWVEERAFREGRSRILREFLDRPVLYNTAFFRERLETRARDNLTRSLAALAVG